MCGACMLGMHARQFGFMECGSLDEEEGAGALPTWLTWAGPGGLQGPSSASYACLDSCSWDVQAAGHGACRPSESIHTLQQGGSCSALQCGRPKVGRHTAAGPCANGCAVQLPGHMQSGELC